jgi:hypothetical protein
VITYVDGAELSNVLLALGQIVRPGVGIDEVEVILSVPDPGAAVPTDTGWGSTIRRVART